MSRCFAISGMAKPKTLLRSHRAGLTGWRLALVYLAIAAFALQSYVVQTHIHFAPRDLARLMAASSGEAGTRGHHDKFPADDDPANCPICQEIIHSGTFVTPAVAPILLPALSVSIILAIERPLPFVSVVSHNWRGRAPPKV